MTTDNTQPRHTQDTGGGVTCELGALTTWGGIPEEGPVPLGGRFLLVTEAQEKVCQEFSQNSTVPISRTQYNMILKGRYLDSNPCNSATSEMAPYSFYSELLTSDLYRTAV